MYTYLYAFTEMLLFSLEHGDIQTRGLNSTITSAAGKATTAARTSTPSTTTATTTTTETADATNAASAATYAGNLNYSQISIYIYLYMLVSN
jgi:hypothetical protein